LNHGKRESGPAVWGPRKRFAGKRGQKTGKKRVEQTWSKRSKGGEAFDRSRKEGKEGSDLPHERGGFGGENRVGVKLMQKKYILKF